MKLSIDSPDIFKNIYEIELTQEPNQSFNVDIEDNVFTIEIETFINKNTFLSVILDNNYIIRYAGVNYYNLNLNFYSEFEHGAFFFFKNSLNFSNFSNFSNFGKDLRLYYGSF